jgi:hypothetical protein
MKHSKKLVVIACVIGSMLPMLASAAAVRLTSYNTILSALKDGHRLTAVADNAKCKAVNNLRKDAKSRSNSDPDLTSIMGINLTSHFFLKYQDEGDKREYVAAIATDTIAGSSVVEAPPVYRYKRIKIYDDNSVEVFASKTDIKTNKGGHYQAFCGLSNGHDTNGVSVFDYDAVG